MTKRIGTQFKKIRTDEGKNLNEFSFFCNVSGVYLSSIERLQTCPSFDVLSAFSKKYDLNLPTLLSQAGFEKRRFFTEIKNFDFLRKQNDTMFTNDKKKHSVVNEFLDSLENKGKL